MPLLWSAPADTITCAADGARGLKASPVIDKAYANLVRRISAVPYFDRNAVKTGDAAPLIRSGNDRLVRWTASVIYKATGNLRAVQILLGVTKIDRIARYIGFDVEDALELVECNEV